MLAEAIDRIRALALDGERVTFVSHQDFPDEVFQVGPQGVTRLGKPAPRRKHSLCGVADLAALANNLGLTQAEVFHGEQGVYMVLDGTKRTEGVLLTLPPTSQLLALRAIAAKPLRASPKEALAWLRRLFLGELPKLHAGLRKVDFVRTTAARSQIERGKESLGKSVEAAVLQVEEIPREDSLMIRPFRLDGLDGVYVHATVSLHLDLDEELVELSVHPDDLAEAEVGAHRQIHRILEQALPQAAVYFGTP